jgi:hypothetical protein
MWMVANAKVILAKELLVQAIVPMAMTVERAVAV